jgi:hypothetical protein
MAVTWHYHVEQMTIADKWSQKAQAAELANLNSRLNTLGSEGWEMVGYESVPLYGSFSNKLKGYAYLMFLKRPS